MRAYGRPERRPGALPHEPRTRPPAWRRRLEEVVQSCEEQQPSERHRPILAAVYLLLANALWIVPSLIGVATMTLNWLGVSLVIAVPVGFVLLGTATGIGGGTIRDTLIDALPVFWVREPAYLVTCVLVSCAAFFLAHIPQSRLKLLLWFDAVGMALFAVTGAEKALLAEAGPIVAVAMGVITATFGGIMRDKSESECKT